MKPLILLAFLGAICALVALTNTSASDKPDPTQVKTMDDLFAEVGAKVPGFAGFFYDEEGIATTSMVDGEIGLDTPDGERAKRALNEVFGENYVDGSDVRVVSAKYSFVQLKSWYDRFWTKVLAMPGVVSTDIDEVHNRLRIGIESWDAEKAPSSLIQEAGVPSDVAQFFLDELAGQDQCIQAPRSLTDPVCPRRGGLKILAYGSGKQCTLGFVVKRSNVTGFVTNSHCTDVQGGVDGTLFYQPAKPTTNPSLDYLGQESVDPTYFTGAPCPSGRSCRFSDSAFTPFAPGLWYNWGAVWRTQSVGDHVPGSIVIDETNATFRVTSATSWPASGTVVDKVGHASGWTTSNSGIDLTCQAHNSSHANITFLCQDHVLGQLSIPGDSGAPVFKITNSPSTGDVRLVGINWTHDSVGLWFSPLGGIEDVIELGNLDVCFEFFPC